MSPNRRALTWIAVVIALVAVAVSVARAQSPQIYLDIEEENANPGTLVPISIFMQNLGDSISAFQMGVTLNRPDLMFFNAETTIKICQECADSACTSLIAYPCTVEVVPISASGTLTENWEYVEARTSGQYDLRITAFADANFDELPGPIPPFTNGILIKVVGQVYCDIPDTLTDRTVVASISAVNTYFADAQAAHILPLDFTEGAVTVGFTQRGDCNGDNSFDALDLNYLIDLLFFGGPGTCPPYAADMDCNGSPDALDLNYLIDYLFFGGFPSPC